MTATIEKRRLARSLEDKVERLLRKAFLEHVARIRDELTITRIERLLREGRVAEAVEVARLAARDVADEWTTGFFLAASAAAVAAGLPSYDRVGNDAVRRIRAAEARFTSELSRDLAGTWRAIAARGVQEQQSTRTIARQIRASVGLSARHEQMVQNYRAALERGSREALRRALRDRRYDASVVRAAERGESLGAQRIDDMVDAYRRRLIVHRAQAIAETAATRALSSGQQSAWTQAVQEGAVESTLVEREWRSRRDGKVRGSHRHPLHGQVRGLDETFLSGAGNQLRYPGDPDAPTSETARCRCRLRFRLRAAP